MSALHIARGFLMLELIRTNHIEEGAELATEVRGLLNDAFPDGAPNELSSYYSRHGIPTTTMLLREGRCVVGWWWPFHPSACVTGFGCRPELRHHLAARLIRTAAAIGDT